MDLFLQLWDAGFTRTAACFPPLQKFIDRAQQSWCFGVAKQLDAKKPQEQDWKFRLN
jgi:hypothetical protein